MSGKEITIKENDIIRFKLRQGLSSELNGATISEGELVYTKDERRVYVGTESNAAITVGSKFIEAFSGTPQIGDFWFETRAQEIKGGNDKTGFLKIQTATGQITVKPALGNGLTYDENGKIAIDNVDESIKSYFESGTKILPELSSKSIRTSEIKFLPDENDYTATELRVPERIKFGNTTIKFNKPETQPAKKQYTLALNNIGTTSDVLEAFFVPFPTGGGSGTGDGGADISFATDNFQVNSTIVDLSKNLKRIDSLTNNQGVKLDIGSLTKTGTVNGQLCVSKEGAGYRVFVNSGANPTGEAKPYTLLKNAIPIAWTNNGKTAPANEVDVCFQVVINNSSATNGMPYCIKYNVTSYDKNALPKGQPSTVGDYFKDISSTQANIWNNSLAVIGCNNYGNLLTEPKSGKGENAVFARSLSPHYSPDFLLTENVETEKTVIPTTAGQLLIAWYCIVVNNTKKYFIDAAFSDTTGVSEKKEYEISSITCNGTEIIDGSNSKIVSSYTYPNDITRFFVYDKTGENMSFVYTKAGEDGREQVEIKPFDNSIQTKKVVCESGELLYAINDQGQLKKIDKTEIDVSDFQYDTLIVRSGEKEPSEVEETTKKIFLQELNTTSEPETFEIISKNEFYHANSHALVPRTIENGYHKIKFSSLSDTSKKLYIKARTTEKTGAIIFGDEILSTDKYSSNRFFKATKHATDTGAEETFDSFKTESHINSFTRASWKADGSIENVINLSDNAMVNLVQLDAIGRVGFETVDASGEPLLYITDGPTDTYKYVGILKSTLAPLKNTGSTIYEHEGNILLYFKRNSSLTTRSFTRHGFNYSFDDCKVKKPTSGDYDPIWCYADPDPNPEETITLNVKISQDTTDTSYVWFEIKTQLWINTYDEEAKYNLYSSSQIKSFKETFGKITKLLASNQIIFVYEVKDSDKNIEYLYLRKTAEPVIKDKKIQLLGSVKGYSNIHDSLFEYKVQTTGSTKIFVPTVLNDVYFNNSGNKVQVNEETPSGYETIQGASSVLLEVSNFTGNTIGLFTAPTLAELKQSDNGINYTTGDINIKDTGYAVETEKKEDGTIIPKKATPNIPSFLFNGTEMFSPAPTERLLMVGYNETTTVVEAPVQNGSIFLRATNIKGSESNPFFIRIIGYR